MSSKSNSNYRRVISRSNLPSRFPTAELLVCFMLIDHFDASPWVFSVWLAFCLIALVIVVADRAWATPVDLLGNERREQ